MFLSFGNNGSSDLAGDQDALLIGGLGDIARDPGRNGYRARHAQPDDDDPVDDVPLDDDPDHGDPVDDDPVDGDRDHDDPDRGDLVDDEPDVPAVDVVEPAISTVVVEGADEWVEAEDFRFAVRPYTWTQGRTRPVQDLSIETLVSITSEVRRDVATSYSAEHTAVVALCADIRSVAEVAALLEVPLGVARVLLADMINGGFIHVHRNPAGVGGAPGLALMERVLAGLNRL